MLISTVYLGSLENVWTVQVRHLLALETLAGPLGKDACPIQLGRERTTKVAKAISTTSHPGAKLPQ